MCGLTFPKQGKVHNNNEEDFATKEALTLSFFFATIIAKKLKLQPMEAILEIFVSLSVEVLWFASPPPQCILKAQTPNSPWFLVVPVNV